MSSSIQPLSSSKPAAAAPPAPAGPIDTLDTDAAKVYTHVHPVLLLSLYAYRFKAIVADPVPALASTLPWLLVLQVAYAIICLPPAGGGTAGTAAKEKEKRRPGEKKKKVEKSRMESVWPKILLVCLSLVGSIVLAMLPIIITLVLMGAPLTTYLDRTTLCAAHIALLTTMPLVYVHGISASTCRKVVGLMVPIDEVQGGLVGTLVGAWLGAVPIPLDWDREWQKWPVTIVTGAYIGFAVGKTLGGSLLKGKKISFDP